MLLRQGQEVPKVIKAHEISKVPYYGWSKVYGGISISQAKRLKELERQNARLHQAASDPTLDKLISKEIARGSF